MWEDYQRGGAKNETRKQLEECRAYGIVTPEQYRVLLAALGTEKMKVTCSSSLLQPVGKHIKWTISVEKDFK